MAKRRRLEATATLDRTEEASIVVDVMVLLVESSDSLIDDSQTWCSSV